MDEAPMVGLMHNGVVAKDPISFAKWIAVAPA